MNLEAELTFYAPDRLSNETSRYFGRLFRVSEKFVPSEDHFLVTSASITFDTDKTVASLSTVGERTHFSDS